MKFLTIALTSMAIGMSAASASVPVSMPDTLDGLTIKKSDVTIIARHGADGPAGDDRGGRGKGGKGGKRGGGADDGPNHT